MAPAAVGEEMLVVPAPGRVPNGAALEAVSDAVDTVNLLKAAITAATAVAAAAAVTATATTHLPLPQDTQTTTVKDHDNDSDKDGRGDASRPAVPAVVLAQASAEDMTSFDSAAAFEPTKDKSAFRQYVDACDRVRSFYAEQHARQTVAHNLAARNRFHSKSRKRPEMTVWEAMEKLDSLVDDSDPDTELGQMQHLLQSAEAIRRDGKPRWMQLVGLLHDLGKLMLFVGVSSGGQWDVVGDTFPVGCAFDERVVFSELFAANPDARDKVFSTEKGIYDEGCGVENLMMSWGHDEYLYLVLRDQCLLPREALAMVRYHSFYAWHREGAYSRFMAEGDEELRRAVQAFNPYDLYSKSDEEVDVSALKPYYLELIDEFFPKKKILW